jgi:hypothetical protein
LRVKGTTASGPRRRGNLAKLPATAPRLAESISASLLALPSDLCRELLTDHQVRLRQGDREAATAGGSSSTPAATLTGKKRQTTGTAKTRAEARQLEARLIREAGTGQHRAAGNKTVAELLDVWRECRAS